ncbi:MAG: hypothetical protein NC830_00030 [Candidatus Omnitrophica bacterium]|nr:hypothetical protein [Candidatus Omnitrophota bacterium]
MKFYDNDPDKQVITEIEQALLQLGIPLLTHYPGHPRAKGKIERMFRFIEGRFVEEVRNRATRLGQLNSFFQAWINWYNNNWRNRDTGCTPEERKIPSVFKLLPDQMNNEEFIEELPWKKQVILSFQGGHFNFPTTILIYLQYW